PIEFWSHVPARSKLPCGQLAVGQYVSQSPTPSGCHLVLGCELCQRDKSARKFAANALCRSQLRYQSRSIPCRSRDVSPADESGNSRVKISPHCPADYRALLPNAFRRREA